MRRIDEQLRAGAAVLEIIDRRRSAEGDPYIGSAIERAIIDGCLADLEADSIPASDDEVILCRTKRRMWR